MRANREKHHEKIDAGKRSILTSLGASSSDRFICTSSGKEAQQKVFLAAYLDFVRETGRTHFLAYPSTVSPRLQQRMEKLGCVVKPLQMNARGQVTREILEEQLRARTALVSLPWVDPFTGVIHPILDLGELCREKEILFHVDGSAALGKFFFRFQDFPIDFLTFEKGVGGAIVRAEKFSNAFELEEESASSTPVLNFSAEIEEVVKQIDHVTTETARLRNKFEEGLTLLGDVSILFSESERVSHISAVRFEGVHHEALHFFLERRGVAATIFGSAHDTLSFCLSCDTSEEEIDDALEIIQASLKKLRAFSVVR